MNMIKVLVLFTVAFSMTGCGESPSSTLQKSSETNVSGIVLDDDKTVVQASIEAKDRNGAVIASTNLNGQDHYNIHLPPGAAYPVILTATLDGQSTVLKAPLTNAFVEQQDISAVSTLVVDTAMSLGGLTEANLAKAAMAAISQRKSTGGSGGSAGFKGDPTKQYGGWH